jgi:hypothetical protein
LEPAEVRPDSIIDRQELGFFEPFEPEHDVHLAPIAADSSAQVAFQLGRAGVARLHPHRSGKRVSNLARKLLVEWLVLVAPGVAVPDAMRMTPDVAALDEPQLVAMAEREDVDRLGSGVPIEPLAICGMVIPLERSPCVVELEPEPIDGDRRGHSSPSASTSSLSSYR